MVISVVALNDMANIVAYSFFVQSSTSPSMAIVLLIAIESIRERQTRTIPSYIFNTLHCKHARTHMNCRGRILSFTSSTYFHSTNSSGKSKVKNLYIHIHTYFPGELSGTKKKSIGEQQRKNDHARTLQKGLD